MVGDEESLPLQEMQARVTVDGFRARVVLDYVFFNPHPHRLEGRFQLRLPDGASPYFLAFGETSVEVGKAPDTRPAVHRRSSDQAAIMTEREPVWNEPKEARMVPREKARRAFEDTVRRQVDPALLEWAGAGVFTARVFPIERGLRYRVVVGYDADLTAVGGDLLERFDVPEGIPHVSVQLDVANVNGTRAVVTPAVQPTRAPGRDIYTFASPEWEKGASIELRLKGVPNIALAHHDASGDSYFAAAFEPVLPATPVQGSHQGCCSSTPRSAPIPTHIACGSRWEKVEGQRGFYGHKTFGGDDPTHICCAAGAAADAKDLKGLVDASAIDPMVALCMSTTLNS